LRAGKANARLLVASWHKDDAVDGGVEPRLVLRELHAGGEAEPGVSVVLLLENEPGFG
jgi:hypothetical protein